ncbi:MULTISPECIES: MDR family oxidoreductase [Paraburkholderia]|uniref:MDR family oxidoreductase n=1 Tax=Paraburkholderia TaxID=1822464 RepID=UPI001B1D378F|nr:MDR family oxidoreductase [Paraburkholderia nemoris]CAE6711303.1 putative acrylyl-CoA reductase AcuI [Paraburkholderia nemoris]
MTATVPERFKAMLLTQAEGRTVHEVKTLGREQLPEGDVTVAIEYSSLNYKDAMAITGKGKIVRQFPMVPGIDFAGTVLESESSDFSPGDKVVLTGWSVGERYWGGYSQVQRLKSGWLLPLPQGLSTRQAMAFGTAGFTAMQCVLALEEDGIRPEHGPVLVTGAAGGVGTLATTFLAGLGYTVHALVSHGSEERVGGLLTALGASEVISGEEWNASPQPLEKQRWAAGVDTVGSNVLVRLLASVNYGGSVAACGLAGGFDLNATVMPFILRGVRLLGIDSVSCPKERRIKVWERIASAVPSEALEKIVREATLGTVANFAQDMMSRKALGRVVVDVNQ